MPSADFLPAVHRWNSGIQLHDNAVAYGTAVYVRFLLLFSFIVPRGGEEGARVSYRRFYDYGSYREPLGKLGDHE